MIRLVIRVVVCRPILIVNRCLVTVRRPNILRYRVVSIWVDSCVIENIWIDCYVVKRFDRLCVVCNNVVYDHLNNVENHHVLVVNNTVNTSTPIVLVLFCSVIHPVVIMVVVSHNCLVRRSHLVIIIWVTSTKVNRNVVNICIPRNLRSIFKIRT